MLVVASLLLVSATGSVAGSVSARIGPFCAPPHYYPLQPPVFQAAAAPSRSGQTHVMGGRRLKLKEFG